MLSCLHMYSYDIHHLFTTSLTQIGTKLYGCIPKTCHEIAWVLNVLVVDMEVTSCSFQWTFHHQHIISNIKQELSNYDFQLLHIWYTKNTTNLGVFVGDWCTWHYLHENCYTIVYDFNQCLNHFSKQMIFLLDIQNWLNLATPFKLTTKQRFLQVVLVLCLLVLNVPNVH
jgi:hypothetical protein